MTKQQIAGDCNQKIKQAENDTRSGRTLDGENQVYVDARELYNPEIEKALKEQKKKIIKIIEDKFYGANDVKVRDIIKEIKKGNYEL